MARVRKSVIEARDILFQLGKDLADTETLFNELASSAPLLSPSPNVATPADPLREEKRKKLRLMAISLICAYWQGAQSKIENVKGIGSRVSNLLYGDMTHGVARTDKARYFPFHNRNMQIVGNVRACIAHHSGKIKPYRKYIQEKFKGPSKSSIRKIKSVPRKYYYIPGDKNPELTLKDNDVRDFFRVANKAFGQISKDFSRMFP